MPLGCLYTSYVPGVFVHLSMPLGCLKTSYAPGVFEHKLCPWGVCTLSGLWFTTSQRLKERCFFFFFFFFFVQREQIVAVFCVRISGNVCVNMHHGKYSVLRSMW